MATRNVIEYGDFQTPQWLADQVCDLLVQLGCTPDYIVEPTCGVGAFLIAAARAFPDFKYGTGIEINESYVEQARQTVDEQGLAERVNVERADFYAVAWEFPADQHVLVIGNPPWVTNTALSRLDSNNLPQKRNEKGSNGIDAITGASNFDVSEYMIQRMLISVSMGRPTSLTVAMLIKSSVARKILKRVWDEPPIRGWNLDAKQFQIDANEAFGVNVDACLLVMQSADEADQACTVYDRLALDAPHTAYGYRDGRLIADVAVYDRWQHLQQHGTNTSYRWRSGIKHDCAVVMELRPSDEQFTNGFDQTIALEEQYLFPMLKSADVNHARPPSRWMLVTQKMVGQETRTIAQNAPCIWAYLMQYADRLDGRKSSIYKGKPRFSMFGVGDYTFAPYKIAISGFYKRLQFQLIRPYQNKPVVFDDTCYLLACQSEAEATLILQLLQSEPAQQFYESLIFWDGKRPITTKLLNSLDLFALAAELGVLDQLRQYRDNDHDPMQLRLLA